MSTIHIKFTFKSFKKSYTKEVHLSHYLKEYIIDILNKEYSSKSYLISKVSVNNSIINPDNTFFGLNIKDGDEIEIYVMRNLIDNFSRYNQSKQSFFQKNYTNIIVSFVIFLISICLTFGTIEIKILFNKDNSKNKFERNDELEIIFKDPDGKTDPQNELIKAEFVKTIESFLRGLDYNDIHKYGNGNIWVGKLKNGKKEGRGLHKISNGDFYVGFFKDGERDGKGYYRFKNGDSFEGFYTKGQRNGKGKYQFRSGNYFIGEFKNNDKNGEGTYFYKNGDKYIGNYKDNKRDGKGIYYYKKGNKEYRKYLKGKLIKSYEMK